jgi:hypothetical protein
VNRRRLFLSLLIGSTAFAQAQHSSEEGTRQLYYLAPEAPAAKAAPKATASAHLGIRYNVVLVHEKGGGTEEVSSNRVLHEGDCFAIDLQTNHAGYLYVLARQSSGSWLPLFPSPDIAGQSNQIEPFKKVEVPAEYCFTIHNPPGKETLFVVFSRDKKDFLDLYESVKARQQKGANVTNDVQMASAKSLDSAVERLNQQYGASRDITITRIPEPVKKDEPRGAVYVVNTSDKLSSSLVTKIEVLHR